MRIAVLQAPSPAGAMDVGLTTLDAALAAAAAAGADVLTVPELFLPGYNQPDMAFRGQTVDAWAALLAPRVRVAGCGLCIGLPEMADGRLHNSAVLFGPDGGVQAAYRKVQLYGSREQALFTAGDGFVVTNLRGSRVALMICYDVEFAAHVRSLADRGVDLILVPTANMRPFVQVPRHIVPAMAAIHGVAIAYANYCDAEGDLTYTGGSLIAGPHGEVLAQAGEGPALLITDLPPRDTARLSTQAADFRGV
jgi:5-aminopentanamidase